MLGWLLLKGRCADCGARISLRYPAMEASFGILAWVFCSAFGTAPLALYYLAFFLALLLIAWVDWETGYIFDAASLPLLALGLPAGWLFPGLLGPWWSGPAAALSLLLGLLALGELGRRLAGREALGGGDVKLMAAVGAFLGLEHSWKALALGVLAGLPLMLLHQRLHGRGWREPAPLGPGLCLGAGLAAWNLLSGGALDPWLDFLNLNG